MKIEASELTVANVAPLVDSGVAAIHAGDLTFDLSAVKAVDSAAIALLLTWQRAAQTVGKRIAMTGCPPGLMSLAKLYGVDQLLAVHPHDS